jgi:DNA-binding MarR family transcriptional regulator
MWLMVKVVNDSLELANELRPVLLRLARLIRRESHELGVTAGQVSLLAAIDDQPGITGRELADHERMTPPGMSAALDRLEAADLIVRTRAADRRRVGISLSSEGVRVLRSVRKRRTAWLAERLEGLSERERAAIEEAIEPLSRVLEEAQR